MLSSAERLALKPTCSAGIRWRLSATNSSRARMSRSCKYRFHTRSYFISPTAHMLVLHAAAGDAQYGRLQRWASVYCDTSIGWRSPIFKFWQKLLACSFLLGTSANLFYIY